jgi:ATP-binding cassette subfamily B protein
LAYATYYPVVELLSSVAIACIIWFGGNGIIQHIHVSTLSVEFSKSRLIGFQVVKGTITLGILVAFMQYAQRFFRPIQDLSEKYNILQSGNMPSGFSVRYRT